MEKIGCHSITKYTNELRAGLPGDDNPTKVSVKKDTLSGRIYDSDSVVSGDIISIVMEVQKIDFISALKLMHGILGLPFSVNMKPRKQYDILSVFKDVRSKKNGTNKTITAHKESVLDSNEYLDLPHISLVREGIAPNVQKEFDIMYDMKRQRILFVHRHWSTGEVVGIFGRTTLEQYDLLGIPKYYGVIPYAKSLNLYGLYQNYKDIQERGCVYVFEGEKSVLKAKSLGFPNSVALGGHELSNEQVKILIGLNVNIVFCLDKDLDRQISLDMCKEFDGIRNTSYIYDKYDLLDGKDAPIDKGIKIFEYLAKYKIEVN